MADDGRLDDPGLVQREEDTQRVRHQEDEDDAHEDHGQVVLVAPARLVVDRRLLVHALATAGLPQFDVLVDLYGWRSEIQVKGLVTIPVEINALLLGAADSS